MGKKVSSNVQMYKDSAWIIIKTYIVVSFIQKINIGLFIFGNRYNVKKNIITYFSLHKPGFILFSEFASLSIIIPYIL